MVKPYQQVLVLLLDAACIAVGMLADRDMRACIVLYWLLLTVRYTLEIWR